MVGSQVELMETTDFSGDKDKNEINLGEWLRMKREACKTHFWGKSSLSDDDRVWWKSINKDTR
jgi:hypothetical protein